MEKIDFNEAELIVSKATLPTITLRGIVAFPSTVESFELIRETSKNATKKALETNSQVFLVTQKNASEEDPKQEDLYQIGVVAKIEQKVKIDDDTERIIISGSYRAKMTELKEAEGYLEATVEEIQESSLEDSVKNEALIEGVVSIFYKYASTINKKVDEIKKIISVFDSIGVLIDNIAYSLPVRPEKKQAILEAIDIDERYEEIIALFVNEINKLEILNEYKEKVNEKVDKHQKEYILREQLAVIRSELGEDLTEDVIENYRKKLKKLKLNKEITDKINKEISRLKMMGPGAPDSALQRTYIETVLDFPWKKKTRDNKDINHAKEVLDKRHYGMEKVKERIIDYLAVRNLTQKGEAPIICLVGPPGTGKTSIAKSVAEALGKKYARISLGGVRDEAEIRGHRRTYLGSMPGRIITAINTTQSRNSLILLDEIDKVSKDFKGDTSAALLEVLDPEQNSKFVDHYIEVPVDLSDILFIATANSLQDISRPLLDRMEVIEVSSYTENEKLHIAREHLLGKQMKVNGLKAENMNIDDDALLLLIRSYTREAGVRNLERQIGKVCRKVARKVYNNQELSIKVGTDEIKDYLGKEIYTFDSKNEEDEVGIVRGLAWTAVGGDTLEIEVNTMPGKGTFKLTGQLGDVMKESAQAGISYIRSMSKEYGISDDYFEKNDIHIHIPEGAVPKDGPSAGVTMTTAMLSAIKKIPVRADVAMTGEITIRGRVLPIGGLKEKILAAKNARIKTVCVPEKNKADIFELSNEITDGIEIVFTKHIKEVLDVAFVK
ncbi:endopeptidase La [Lachnobacterium bovis]|uniref:Lon protease n=1 Tax=Lachnobacterium bovis DSM 14045 TaxID=1122142 RepID=A0A1H3LYR0_9FIRM|nr:endopeptidase La [Lachnobacterium bovis]SDY69581.1 ATP-dependent Lon protease [Lachnobacterium bovis DSM 14045]